MSLISAGSISLDSAFKNGFFTLMQWFCLVDWLIYPRTVDGTIRYGTVPFDFEVLILRIIIYKFLIIGAVFTQGKVAARLNTCSCLYVQYIF